MNLTSTDSWAGTAAVTLDMDFTTGQMKLTLANLPANSLTVNYGVAVMFNWQTSPVYLGKIPAGKPGTLVYEFPYAGPFTQVLVYGGVIQMPDGSVSLVWGSQSAIYSVAAPAPVQLPPGLARFQADLVAGKIICDPPRQSVDIFYEESFLPVGNLGGVVNSYANLVEPQLSALASEIGATVDTAYAPARFVPALRGNPPELPVLVWKDQDPDSPNFGKTVMAFAGELNTIANCGKHTIADLRACCVPVG